jgi:hypothetical protein
MWTPFALMSDQLHFGTLMPSVGGVHFIRYVSFYFAGSFAGNSSFKAVLAASPVLFTAHYREWCPRIIRQTNLVVSIQKFWAAIMSFCTSMPSWVIPFNPVFYLQC